MKRLTREQTLALVSQSLELQLIGWEAAGGSARDGMLGLLDVLNNYGFIKADAYDHFTRELDRGSNG